jgi:hypothetical protein
MKPLCHDVPDRSLGTVFRKSSGTRGAKAGPMSSLQRHSLISADMWHEKGSPLKNPFVALAEFAISIALVAGLFAPRAALGSLGLLFTYVMSGTASVCAFYALFALVPLATWRTSSWLGAEGLISGHLQRRHDRRLAGTPAHAISVAHVAQAA